MSLAIIKTGGKQYLVKSGDKIKVEKLPGEVGSKIQLDTLLIADDKTGALEVGKPMVKSKVAATIIKQDRSDKVTVIKYKAKVRYRRKVGHRQHYSQIQIDKI